MKTNAETRDRSRGSELPDMSPAAIARRLEQLRALFKLAMSLRAAAPTPPFEDERRAVTKR